MRWPRWFGPIVDLNDQTVRPFYDPRSIRSAFAMDLTPRTAEVVHRRLISKVEALDAAPFANDRWRADPASTPEPPVTGPVTVRHVAVDSAGPSPTQAAVQEIVHGSRVDHQLFSVAHRDVLIDAADRFDHLRGAERGQVLGAVTALRWDPPNAAGAT